MILVPVKSSQPPTLTTASAPRHARERAAAVCRLAAAADFSSVAAPFSWSSIALSVGQSAVGSWSSIRNWGRPTLRAR